MTETEAELLALKTRKITEFKQAFKDMIATSKGAYVKSDARSVRQRNAMYSRSEIERIVQCGDAVEKAELSEHFFKTNGIYKRIILHYATFLMYAWLLVPHAKNNKKLKEKKMKKAYEDATFFANNFQIERKCSLFAKDVLVKGAYFGLLHNNGDSIAIQDLPFAYCRSRFKNTKDVDIIEFDMKFFDNIRDAALRIEILKTYPKIIQKAYQKYKNGKGERWVFIPDNMGIYFKFFDESPFFLDLIPLLDDLEDYKEMDKSRNKLALDRILVQQVKTDGMNLVFETDEAEVMHEGAVNMLSNNDNLDVLTTYNNVELLDLSGNNDNNTKIKDVQELIYESAGVSKELFSATTDAGLTYSLNNDLSMMMVLGLSFAQFFSVLIDGKFGNTNLGFKMIILPISQYNAKDYTAHAKDMAAFGYSLLTPVAGTGMNQANLVDLKTVENDLLELDKALIPLQSSYTQSGKTNAITAAAGKQTSSQAPAANDSTEKKETETTEKKETEKEGNE